MTKISLILAASFATFAVPAFAQHADHQHRAYQGTPPSQSANDPCVLGANGQSGACVGPLRVAPMIMSQGAVQVQPSVDAYSQPNFPAQAVDSYQSMTMAPLPIGAMQSAGCIPGYSAPTVPCNGFWVAAVNPTPQPVQVPAPVFTPTQQYLPAPIFVSTPIVYAPQVQQIGFIPTSFFTGGITYGAGFPTDSTYVYGGGGYAYSSGGARFSGVRERSPTPLTPPHRPRPHTPPGHHGCGC